MKALDLQANFRGLVVTAVSDADCGFLLQASQKGCIYKKPAIYITWLKQCDV